MNSKVYIFQDGTIPSSRIIDELKSRGGKNRLPIGGSFSGRCYFIEEGVMTFCESMDELKNKGYRRLYYSPYEDTFSEIEQAQTKPKTIKGEIHKVKLTNGNYIFMMVQETPEWDAPLSIKNKAIRAYIKEKLGDAYLWSKFFAKVEIPKPKH